LSFASHPLTDGILGLNPSVSVAKVMIDCDMFILVV